MNKNRLITGKTEEIGLGKSIAKYLICGCFLSLLFVSPVLADDEEEFVENAYYAQGQQYLQNFQYTSAISEFKKALRENPTDLSSKIGLTNAYVSRAMYFNNKCSEPQKAANDLRSALFYMKYYDEMSSDNGNSQSMIAAQQSLNTLLTSLNVDTSPNSRCLTAKNLRAQGEFAASAYEFFQVINDNRYKKDAYSGIGDVMRILGQFQKAVFYYENAVKLDSKNAELHLKLARAYEAIDNPEGAVNEYNLSLQNSNEKEDILISLQKIWQQKIAVNPKDAEAHSNLGVVYQKQGNYVAALESYKQAEILSPTNVNNRLNLATLYQTQKNYQAAIGTYDSILLLYPNNVQCHIYKAQCLKELGQNEDAAKEYKLALGYDSTNSQAREELFDVLKSTMPAEQILAYLYQNVQNQPLNPNLYYDFAYELHKANKLDDAIIYYKETLKLNPESIDSYINLSQVYRQKNNLTEAQNVIAGAKKLFPSNTDIQNQYKSIMAEVGASSLTTAAKLFEAGSYASAIASYSKIQPPTSESLLGIAASHQALGNLKLAVDFYKKALVIDPSNADIYYYIGSVYSDLDNYTVAKTYLKKSLAIDKTNVKAKSLLDFATEQENSIALEKALKLYDLKKYTEALALLNGMITKNPQNGSAYYYRGMVYDAQNKYALAIVDYQNTLKYTTDLPLAYYSLAVDYDSTGRAKDAKIQYQKYLLTKPEESDFTKYSRKRVAEIK